jgi:hypothetical protein
MGQAKTCPNRPWSLTFLALGGLAVSYAAIAMLVRGRGWVIATVAALLGEVGAFCGALLNVLVGVCCQNALWRLHLALRQVASQTGNGAPTSRSTRAGCTWRN